MQVLRGGVWGDQGIPETNQVFSVRFSKRRLKNRIGS